MKNLFKYLIVLVLFSSNVFAETKTDWNKLLDVISNRWMNPSLQTPGIDESLIHSCLWQKIDPSFLSGDYLIDGIYNVGTRVDMYYKLHPTFDQLATTLGNTIDASKINCDKYLKKFSK